MSLKILKKVSQSVPSSYINREKISLSMWESMITSIFSSLVQVFSFGEFKLKSEITRYYPNSTTILNVYRVTYNSRKLYGERWTWEEIDSTYLSVTGLKEKNLNAENIYHKVLEIKNRII